MNPKTRNIIVAIAIVVAIVFLLSYFRCDYCGKIIFGDPVRSSGRSFCDYHCSAEDLYFNGWMKS